LNNDHIDDRHCVPDDRKNILDPEGTAIPLTRDKAQRDMEILRLWDEKWAARKIADHLSMKECTVAAVIRKNGRCRNPTGSRKLTVNLQDAPVDAWQQAMLPYIEEEADGFGVTNVWKRAFVFASLLRMKKYDGIASFIDWAAQVTGYERDEIEAFVERGVRSKLIIYGQPNEQAFRDAETEQGGGDFTFLMMVGVFEGTFERTADDRYWLGGRPIHSELSQWEDDGGCFTPSEQLMSQDDVDRRRQECIDYSRAGWHQIAIGGLSALIDELNAEPETWWIHEAIDACLAEMSLCYRRLGKVAKARKVLAGVKGKRRNSVLGELG
jgi:hypothetical protein